MFSTIYINEIASKYQISPQKAKAGLLLFNKHLSDHVQNTGFLEDGLCIQTASDFIETNIADLEIRKSMKGEGDPDDYEIESLKYLKVATSADFVIITDCGNGPVFVKDFVSDYAFGLFVDHNSSFFEQFMSEYLA